MELLGALGLDEQLGVRHGLHHVDQRLRQGTEAADQEEEYARHWEWTEVAGLYHFSNKYHSYLTDQATGQSPLQQP